MPETDPPAGTATCSAQGGAHRQGGGVRRRRPTHAEQLCSGLTGVHMAVVHVFGFGECIVRMG